VPALPLIDLLILAASANLVLGFFLKALWVTGITRGKFLGLGPIDFLMIAGVALMLALTLAARTWVKANEPLLLRALRRAQLEDFSAWEARDVAVTDRPRGRKRGAKAGLQTQSAPAVAED
jgi:hypothetical protein